jgi:hypothetical protein
MYAEYFFYIRGFTTCQARFLTIFQKCTSIKVERTTSSSLKNSQEPVCCNQESSPMVESLGTNELAGFSTVARLKVTL